MSAASQHTLPDVQHSVTMLFMPVVCLIKRLTTPIRSDSRTWHRSSQNAAILQPRTKLTNQRERFPRSRFPLTANPKVRGSVPGEGHVAVSPRVESASGFTAPQQQPYARQRSGKGALVPCFVFCSLRTSCLMCLVFRPQGHCV